MIYKKARLKFLICGSTYPWTQNIKMNQLYSRWQRRTVEQAMATRRVVLLTGARQCGKTTLAKQLISDDTTYLTLDDVTLKEAAENDPQDFVKHKPRTLIIDEIQRVPSLLPAIKKIVDEHTQPGQYLLTGSANIQILPTTQEFFSRTHF